jgi:hypothetical protein
VVVRQFNLGEVIEIVGDIDFTKFAFKAYRVDFDDGTPSFPIFEIPSIRAEIPYIPIMIAMKILEHWEDHNIPPIPEEVKL